MQDPNEQQADNKNPQSDNTGPENPNTAADAGQHQQGSTPTDAGTSKPENTEQAAPASDATTGAGNAAQEAATPGMPPVPPPPTTTLSSDAANKNPAEDKVASFLEAKSQTPVIPGFDPMSAEQQKVKKIANAVDSIRKELGKVIIGQHDMIDLMLAGIFTGGHVLLEGVPGIAKTLSAKLLAQSLSVEFSRMQFTPDLMPADVVGTTVFNMKTSDFTFHKGPVFSNVVLIDEINRSPAKTQAALFEVMEEKQITVDGTTYPMDFPFFVIATQNPIEQEGTYKLPEAQLDRFLFRIKMKYPNLEEEKAILKRFRNDFSQKVNEEVKAVMTADDIRSCQEIVEQVHIKDELTDYIAEIIHNTRNNW